MKLTRSRDDVMVSGVLAGLGEYFNMDPTLLRIGVAILMFLGAPFIVPLYVIGAIIIPKAPKKEARKNQRQSSKRRRKTDDYRNFEETNKYEDYPSSKVDEIEEEDWSDF